jgi:hypothetical protein
VEELFPMDARVKHAHDESGQGPSELIEAAIVFIVS